MKPLISWRLRRISMCCVLCAAVLIALAWTAQAGALPLQSDRLVALTSGQPPTMTACLPCASCYLAPPAVASIHGNGDHPGLMYIATTRRFIAANESEIVVPDFSVRPTLALRVVYCRWLN
ncbi:hypothetical protein [Collimonas sp. PA-H2]|uniref:hypothetical protein n=1 Tax=Collimonas sp. PA-H2 TaxID=1881062 RepID=UPI00117E871F|nr:hypothetical protein [Collimonas sp. PA-H2]